MLRRSRKGQSTAEYAIVIGLVLAAAIGMQVYVKRGMQGKVRNASDAKIVIPGGGSDYGVNTWTQYEPQYSITPLMTSKQDSTETATVSVGGGVGRVIDAGAENSRRGTQETTVP